MISLVVQKAADEVYRVEVGGVGHGLHGSGIGLVDLDAFQNLERCAAILAGDDVGAAAGLAFIAHHATDADGTVELGAQHFYAFCLRVGKRKLDAEMPVKEVLYLVAELYGRVFVQGTEVLEDLVPELERNAHENLLVFCGDGEIFLVSHVVNVLDGYQFFLHLVKVVDEGSVACRTEEKSAVILAEGLVVLRYGDGVRSLVLIRESDVVLHSVALFILRKDLCHCGLEEFCMLRGDGDGKVAGAVGIPHVLLGLYKVFCDGGAHL